MPATANKNTTVLTKYNTVTMKNIVLSAHFLSETTCFPDSIQIKCTEWVYREHGLVQETFRNS